jgi:hypothetical protein
MKRFLMSFGMLALVFFVSTSSAQAFGGRRRSVQVTTYSYAPTYTVPTYVAPVAVAPVVAAPVAAATVTVAAVSPVVTTPVVVAPTYVAPTYVAPVITTSYYRTGRRGR